VAVARPMITWMVVEAFLFFIKQTHFYSYTLKYQMNRLSSSSIKKPFEQQIVKYVICHFSQNPPTGELILKPRLC